MHSATTVASPPPQLAAGSSPPPNISIAFTLTPSVPKPLLLVGDWERERGCAAGTESKVRVSRWELMNSLLMQVSKFNNRKDRSLDTAKWENPFKMPSF